MLWLFIYLIELNYFYLPLILDVPIFDAAAPQTNKQTDSGWTKLEIILCG